MQKLYQRSIFIFRRDLRISDNTGLLKALELSQIVIPCFIFDPRQVSDSNIFASMNAMQFMIESLQDLQKNLDFSQVLPSLCSAQPAEDSQVFS